MPRRPVPWFVASLVAVLLAGATAVAGPVTERLLRARLGDPELDSALDERGVAADAQLMTVDPDGPRLVVSYEYVHGGDLFVGYQRLSRQQRPGVPMDDVVIEVLDDQPQVSRLRDSRRAPGSELVSQWRQLGPIRAALGFAWLLAALGTGLRGLSALRSAAP